MLKKVKIPGSAPTPTTRQNIMQIDLIVFCIILQINYQTQTKNITSLSEEIMNGDNKSKSPLLLILRWVSKQAKNRCS